MVLVTYDMAKAHLKLPDDNEVEDVERKIAQATAMVMIHINRMTNPDGWSENTDPSSDLEYALVQAAILELTADLYRYRGDDDESTRVEQEWSGAYLKPNLRRKLTPLRRPSFA